MEAPVTRVTIIDDIRDKANPAEMMSKQKAGIKTKISLFIQVEAKSPIE